ncbi:hypothetical protein [Botrimarina sp.]|uniref:hypothetical protein n=1 Tax=Botrimarina sp. TaxID=2795802 RepID=UPI0032EA9A18
MNQSRILDTARRSWRLALTLTATCGLAPAATPGLLEDFEGVPASWGVEQQYALGLAEVVPDGGPLGAGDGYLVYESTGVGRGGARMTLPADTFGAPDWAGDYAGSGVTGVSADVRNPGDTPLSLRLAVSSSGASYTTTTPVVIPAGSEWLSVALVFEDSAFTNLTGNEGDWPLSRVLGAVEDIRFLSSEDLPTLGNPYPRGDVIAATIAVDNVLLTPEPSSCLLLSLAAATALPRRRCSRG